MKTDFVALNDRMYDVVLPSKVTVPIEVIKLLGHYNIKFIILYKDG